MGCQHCTSPRLSQLTWAVTSAWRRAPNREPPFTSMWKVDKQNCPCLSASACVWVLLRCLSAREQKENWNLEQEEIVVYHCSDREQCVWVCLQKKVFVTLPRTGTVDTEAIYWVHYLVFLYSLLDVTPHPLGHLPSLQAHIMSWSQSQHLLLRQKHLLFFLHRLRCSIISQTSVLLMSMCSVYYTWTIKAFTTPPPLYRYLFR